MSAEPLWQPDPQQAARSHLNHFTNAVRAAHGYRGDGYGALHHWSVTQPSDFWQALADYAGIRFHERAAAVLTDGTGLCLPEDVERLLGAVVTG